MFLFAKYSKVSSSNSLICEFTFLPNCVATIASKICKPSAKSVSHVTYNFTISCRAELIHHLYNWYVSQNVALPVQEEVVVDVPLESAIDTEFVSVEQPKKRTKKK